MKKAIMAVALAAVSVWAGGCRLFCDDHPSRCCGYESTPTAHVPSAP